MKKFNNYQRPQLPKRVDKALQRLLDWAYKAGRSAFAIRVQQFNNPYKVEPFRGQWIRGYKRAEREWNERNGYGFNKS